MVPANSTRVSPAPAYSGYHYHLYLLPLRDSHPLWYTFPGISDSKQRQTTWSYYPHVAVTTQVWANPRSLATTYGITIVFSSSRYLDVSVPWVNSPEGVTGLQPAGLSHSEIFGSNHMCWSPKLIAAYHVLHRLWEPRHSPHALIYFLITITLN